MAETIDGGDYDGGGGVHVVVVAGAVSLCWLCCAGSGVTVSDSTVVQFYSFYYVPRSPVCTNYPTYITLT